MPPCRDCAWHKTEGRFGVKGVKANSAGIRRPDLVLKDNLVIFMLPFCCRNPRSTCGARFRTFAASARGTALPDHLLQSHWRRLRGGSWKIRKPPHRRGRTQSAARRRSNSPGAAPESIPHPAPRPQCGPKAPHLSPWPSPPRFPHSHEPRFAEPKCLTRKIFSIMMLS